jgi:hypothetical protein
MNHIAQNKMLILCQEKQLQYRDRLDQVVHAWAKDQEAHETKRIEKQSIHNSRMISFLTEVLNARQASHGKEFEVLYHQCNDQSRSWNETHLRVINNLSQKLKICEHTAENIQTETHITENQKDLAYTQIVDEKKKLLKELSNTKAHEHSLTEELIKLKGEVIRLRKELDAVRAGARSDATFFASIVPETKPNEKKVDNEFSSSSRIHKPELLHQEVDAADYDDSEDEKVTIPPPEKRPAPTRIKLVKNTQLFNQKDCAKLAFEFNKKRFGTALI